MSIETPVGGQWELIRRQHNDSVSNGYTAQFQVDGGKYRMFRFQLGFVGQSLMLTKHTSSEMSGAINKVRHDGSGNYLHPHRPTGHVDIFNRGTGWLKGFGIPRRTGENGWLMCFNGYSAYDASGSWVAAGGDYFMCSGRIYWWRIPTSTTDWSNFQMGFGSYAGQDGAMSLVVEGLRG